LKEEGMTDLIECIKYIRDGQAKLPQGGTDGYQARRKATEALAQAIGRDLPKVKITERYDGARVSIAGIRASSTGGIDGALTNWIAAARRQLDKTGFVGTSGEKENIR
jgi:hypothetical protein